MTTQYADRNTALHADEVQPIRNKKLQERVREFDQTFLDPDAQIVHRDYAAHFFRWGFAKQHFIEHEVTQVLDVGCGPDKPLMTVLFGGIAGPFAKTYTGVDMNKIKPTKHKRTVLYPETNFLEQWKQIRKARGPFDLITNFEVIEHMPMAKGLELLKAFKGSLNTSGVVLLSTPVYDGKARARNHIHEYTIPELAGQIKKAGLKVLNRYGTFMNANEVKKCASPQELSVYKSLQQYYSNDVLSTFLAPLHPDQSRNNLWVLGG